jgi:hypothetical protein
MLCDPTGTDHGQRHLFPTLFCRWFTFLKAGGETSGFSGADFIYLHSTKSLMHKKEEPWLYRMLVFKSAFSEHLPVASSCFQVNYTWFRLNILGAG